MIEVLAALLIAAQPTDGIMQTVESELGDRLTDGESARWRWWPAKDNPDGTVELCGFVNAKNRLGGYSGFNPVWVVGRREGNAFTINNAEIASGPYLDGIAARRCIAAGFQMELMPPK